MPKSSALTERIVNSWKFLSVDEMRIRLLLWTGIPSERQRIGEKISTLQIQVPKPSLHPCPGGLVLPKGVQTSPLNQLMSREE